jgi:glycosyltransferase involved in cell wall biosynthesis
METLVSICIPNYNYEQFISETIDSVINQTYKNIEIIICDNCSTDNSLNIIKRYKDPRIKVYTSTENINLYENINKAISLSCGELIGVLHSDDIYLPNFIETVVNQYNKYPDKKVFVSDAYNYHYESNIKNLHKPFQTVGIKPNTEVLFKLQIKNIIGNGVNVLIHKDCIATAGMYSSKFRYASDLDYWLRLADHFDFVYIDKPLALYRIHNSNLSHTVNRNLDMFQEVYEILKLNRAKSMVLSSNIINKTDEIRKTRIFKSCIIMGIKYKSGKLIREMLACSNKNMPGLNKDKYFTIVNTLSFLLGENMPERYVKTFELLQKFLLYPKVLAERKLIKNSEKYFEFDKVLEKQTNEI